MIFSGRSGVKDLNSLSGPFSMRIIRLCYKSRIEICMFGHDGTTKKCQKLLKTVKNVTSLGLT